MELPDRDRDFLEDKNYDHEVVDKDGFLNVIIRNFPMPDAYKPTAVTMLIRLPQGFPLTPPDMFFTQPRVTLASNGAVPHAADANIVAVEQTWQQWSRHFPKDEWRPNVDSLRTYVSMVISELKHGV